MLLLVQVKCGDGLVELIKKTSQVLKWNLQEQDEQTGTSRLKSVEDDLKIFITT
jgi:hypothetical protein